MVSNDNRVPGMALLHACQGSAQQDSVAVLRELIERAGEGYETHELAALYAAIESLQSQQGASADRGEAVAYRYKDSRGHWRYVGSRPNFPTEYRSLNPEPLYAATPPSPAESAAPSGVSDGLIARLRREAGYAATFIGDERVVLLVVAERLLAQQPQPGIGENGRVEGMDHLLRKIRDLLASKPIDCLGESCNGELNWPVRDEVIADITKALAPTAGGQEADHG